MAIKEALTQAMKEAMKAKESEKLSIIRLALNSIKNIEKDKQRELSDLEMIEAVQKMVKQGEDSQQQYLDANRPELAEKEQAEVLILKTFLPEPLSQSELMEIIEQSIKDCQASSMKDMGHLMQHIKPQVVGRSDLSKLSQIIRDRLS